jgi:hypothetical protein
MLKALLVGAFSLDFLVNLGEAVYGKRCLIAANPGSSDEKTR